MTWIIGRRAAVLLVTAASCATPGTHPGDMSAPGHLAAAAAAETEAVKSTHTAPGRLAAPERCVKQPCWTGAIQQTDEAKHLIAVAAQHRAAAQSLRDAEAKECAGISESDRDISPFFHREDIAGATRWVERQGRYGEKTKGAVVEFRAVPGLTAEWLQHSVNCHIARSAVLGYETPEMSFCPLALKGVTAHVRSGGDRFLVEIEAKDASVADEVWRRSAALVTKPSARP